MGFKIFAAGTNNFHYKREGCEDGSTFEFIDLITKLQGLDASSLGNAAKSGAKDWVKDKIKPIPGIVDVMKLIAYNEMLHNLSNAVCSLAMKNSSGGWIFVDATETNALWADTVRSAKYEFSPGNSPAAEFVSAIGRCLKDTDLDNFGVLQQLSIALTRFSFHIDDTTTPQINISLTH